MPWTINPSTFIPQSLGILRKCYYTLHAKQCLDNTGILPKGVLPVLMLKLPIAKHQRVTVATPKSSSTLLLPV